MSMELCHKSPVLLALKNKLRHVLLKEKFSAPVLENKYVDFLNRYLYLDVSWIFDTDHIPKQFYYLFPKTYNYICFFKLSSGTVSFERIMYNIQFLHLPYYQHLKNHQMTQTLPSKQLLNPFFSFSTIAFSPPAPPSSVVQIMSIICQVFSLPVISYFNPLSIHF